MRTTFWLFFATIGCTEVGSPSTPRFTGEAEVLGDAPEEHIEEGWLFTPTVIHDFKIELSEDAQASLGAEPLVDVPATFRFDGRSYEVGIHLRGNRSFRTLEQKPSFKIDFGEYNDEQTLKGVRRLTLNNMVQDGSMLRDEAAYFLFRAAGVPAPRHGYARVWVNDEWYGLYGITETIDEQFLSRSFSNTSGNAYSGGYGADLLTGCAHLFELKEEGDTPPYSDLEELIVNVMDSDTHEIVDVLDTSFNSDALLRHFAVEIISGQPDGYVRYANNFILYGEPARPTWWMIPWGPDQSFTEKNDLFEEWHGQLAKRCSWDSTCRDRLEAHANDILTIWESNLLNHVLTIQAVIAADCEADPRRELSCDSDQERLLDYIQEQPAKVREELEKF